MSNQGKALKLLAFTILFLSVATALGIGVLLFTVYKDINFTADELLFDNSRSFESTRFFANASDGEEYEPVAIEISGSIRKVHYSLDEISTYLKEGFIAVEDKIFYEHSGVDLKRTLMATANYIMGKEKTFGASTITQQVVKNISGDNQLSVKRKISEIIRAFHIEREYTKEEILEVYLNVIPMGDNIYGVGAAARAYFGKDPINLLPEESATLIGITNAPTAYSPYLHPDACLKKRNVILGVMLKDKVIDQNEYDKAVSSPLSVIPREQREDRFDSWFVETAINDICKDFAVKYDMSESAARIMLLGGGYKIYTTMNQRVQSCLEKYFENLDNFPCETKSGLNYAFAVTDSLSGDLVGVIGRVGEKKGNRLLSHASAPHVPASTLKPLALYAPLIDQGRINWATVFDDVPKSFTESEGGYIEYPKNSPNVYDGLITVSDAIRLSKNTIAIELCNIMKPRAVFDMLRANFEFDSIIEREGTLTDIALSPMALGQLGRGVSLIELTEAYGAFPSDGTMKNARTYISVYDYKGNITLENKKSNKRVFKESTSRIMNQLLMGVTESGTAKAITLKDKIQVAGKTGTSSGNKDKLFIGYTPYYAAGIWCGYDNGESIGKLSKSGVQIWDEVMTLIHDDIIAKENPKHFSTEGLLLLPYCADSGKEYSEVCIFDPRGTRRRCGYFTKDNRPTGECDRHIMCLYDSVTKAVASDGCPKENLVPISLISVPERMFPKEVTITDAEFVYRNIGRFDERPIDYALPYFAYTIPDGVFVGRSKGKKQFNSNCYLHDD